jgi:hypothetical protein
MPGMYTPSMPWLLDVTPPVKFGNRCALCNDEESVTTITSDHQNVTGFVGVAWVLQDLRLEVPCGPRCDRRMRALTWIFWTLFILPWLLLLAVSLRPPDGLVQNDRLWFLVLGAGFLNVLGYIAFLWRWWMRRTVRLIRVEPSRATLAIRDTKSAARIADLNNSTPKRVFWTG